MGENSRVPGQGGKYGHLVLYRLHNGRQRQEESGVTPTRLEKLATHRTTALLLKQLHSSLLHLEVQVGQRQLADFGK